MKPNELLLPNIYFPMGNIVGKYHSNELFELQRLVPSLAMMIPCLMFLRLILVKIQYLTVGSLKTRNLVGGR